MLSFECAIPDFGIVRIDDFADGNDPGIVLPVLVIEFVFGLSRDVQRRTQIGQYSNLHSTDCIAEITPIVKTRIRVVFILFSFLNVFRTSSASTEVTLRWTVGPGRNVESPHITARDINPSPFSIKAGTCRTRKLSLLLSRDVQATIL